MIFLSRYDLETKDLDLDFIVNSKLILINIEILFRELLTHTDGTYS